jgi:hypothetical protein
MSGNTRRGLDHLPLTWCVGWVLLFLLSFAPGQSFAYGDIAKKQSGYWALGPNAPDHYSSCAAGCAALNPSGNNGAQSTTTSGHNCGMNAAQDGGTCYYHFETRSMTSGQVISSGDAQGQFIGFISAYGCPSGSSPKSGDSTMCTCGPGMKPSGGECVALDCNAEAAHYNAVTAATGKTSVASATKTGPSSGVCSNGCRITGEMTAQAANGLWVLYGPYRNGGACSVAEAPSGSNMETAPVACAKGTCPGQVNGQNVCVACSSSSQGGPSTSSSAPGTGASGAGGSSSTDSKTECADGQCTTTKTTRDGNGNVTGEETTTQDQSSFCQDNPNTPICKNSTYGAGACGAVPSCDGDAIQCAIAQQSFKARCDLMGDGSGANGIAEEAAAAGLRGGDHPYGSPDAKDMSFASAIDQTNGLSGGCPSDVTLHVAYATVTIPWSRACESLQMLGQIAVAVCMLAAAGIVFKN